jgi:RNA polymerase sigma-70 factor (ECF subfamily)
LEPRHFKEDYIDRLRSCDPETERDFAAYFSDLLLIKLRKSVRSPQLIFDVRQETLLRVLQVVRAGGLDHPERLGAFVCAVSNNVLLEHFRAEGRYDQGSPTLEPADDRIVLDRELINQDRKRQVDAVLAELPPKDCELLRMVFLEERERGEVCRHFKVSPEYLRVVLHRAKARFREKFIAGEAAAGETRDLGMSL